MGRPLTTRELEEQSTPERSGQTTTDLRRRTAAGIFFTFSAQAVRLLMQLASTAILARLLLPEAFGLVAMAMVITGVAQVVVDGGLSMATIQRPSITNSQVSALFWINSALGVGMSILIISASPLIATVYGEPGLVPICLALSMLCAIAGLTVQAEALMRRQMRFRELAAIDVAAMFLGIIGAIGAAIAGMGYWALVISPLVTASCRLISVWSVNRWRPGLPTSAKGLDELLLFGAHVVGANFIGTLAANVTPFVVAMVGGPNAAGLFNRAASLSTLPSSQFVPPIMAVAQPALARVADEPERFRRAALILVSRVSLIASFVTVLLVGAGDWAIHLLLGAAWLQCTPILRALAVFAFVEPVASSMAAIVLARGHASVLLRSKAITLVTILLSAAIGLPFGVLGIVWSYSLSGILIRMPIFVLLVSNASELRQMEVYSKILRSVAIAVVAAGAVFAMRIYLGPLPPIIGIVSVIVLVVTVYFVVFLAFRSAREELVSISNKLGDELYRQFWRRGISGEV